MLMCPFVVLPLLPGNDETSGKIDTNNGILHNQPHEQIGGDWTHQVIPSKIQRVDNGKEEVCNANNYERQSDHYRSKDLLKACQPWMC